MRVVWHHLHHSVLCVFPPFPLTCVMYCWKGRSSASNCCRNVKNHHLRSRSLARSLSLPQTCWMQGRKQTLTVKTGKFRFLSLSSTPLSYIKSNLIISHHYEVCKNRTADGVEWDCRVRLKLLRCDSYNAIYRIFIHEQTAHPLKSASEHDKGAKNKFPFAWMWIE